MLRSSFGRLVAAALVLVGVAAGAYWAGRTVVEPPLTQVPEPRPATYQARRGTIADTQPFTVESRWPRTGSIRAGREGTVTSISRPGVKRAGDVVALVDEQPVVLVRSEVPFFRDLGPGARGRDVAALQRHLARQGSYGGKPDGVFGSETEAAVRSWQRAAGVADDGVVALGDVAALPDAEVRTRPSAAVGDLVAPGDVLVDLLSERPEFSIVTQADRAADLVTGAGVEIRAPDAVWQGVIGEIIPSENDLLVVDVTAPGGGAPCGRCAQVPIVGTARYPSIVSIVAEVTGVVVPTSAIKSLPDGTTAVIGAGGAELPVEVVEAIDGLAVVEGIEEGTEVMLPGPDS